MLYTPEDTPWHVRLMQLPLRAMQGLAAIGRWIVWPLDFLIHCVARLVFGTAESLDAAEYGASRVLSVVLAPFHLIRYLLAKVFQFIRAFIVWPVEFVFVSLLGKLFAGYEASEGIGFFFTRLRWAIMGRLQALRDAAAEST